MIRTKANHKPSPVSTPEGREVAAEGSEVPVDAQEMIRKRAYELYEEGGRQDGRSEEDWLRAEREIHEKFGQK